MSLLPCRHRLLPEEESFCWLETAAMSDGAPTLAFNDGHGRPLRCTGPQSSACPFRERPPPKARAEMVPCPYCRGRHRNGSNSQQLCEAWSGAKAALARLRRELPEGRRYYEEGTTAPPYDEGTTMLIRRLVWQRLQPLVLRRDRYRCQDCGANFAARRRKVYDPALRRGKGGYRWESLEVHHIIARSLGGSDHPGNLKTLCPSCHASYTQEQAAARNLDRRKREAVLRALEMSRHEDEEIDGPLD